MSLHQFGSPERFAVDIDVEPDEDALGTAFLSFTVGGIRFGATDRTEQLSTFLIALERFMKVLPQAPTEFHTRTAQAVFDEVIGMLRDPDPGRDGFRWELSDRYEKLVLSPNGCASFDGDWVLLLCEPDRDRLLIRPFSKTELREVVLQPGEVEAVIRSVIGHAWRQWQPEIIRRTGQY